MNDIPKPITPIWFYNTFVLPIYFDDDLNSYQKLLKIQYKINEIIKNQTMIIGWMNQLKEWIDIQLEHYTKEQLNEWLDDGTLEKIIKAILVTSYVYNTTAEMIKDENLKKDDKCYTLGYYNFNDKGENEWLVTDTKPESYSVLLDNGLYAERINTGKSNVIQYGLKYNESEPKNELIQQIINENNYIEFNKGIYYITLMSPYSINLHDSVTINGNGAILKGFGNYEDSYYTILGISAKNVLIKDLVIDGAKDIVTVSGEHGMCTTVTGENITFNSVTFQNAFGDGVIIDKYAKNINIESCNFYGCRRQGISICGCNNVIIKNCNINNIAGTAPGDGIDIEPYEDMDCKNIIIENVNINNCAGFGIQGYFLEMTSKNTSIFINNVNIDSCLGGYAFTSILTPYNIIDINNSIIKNTKTTSIYLNDVSSANYNVNFENITFINYNNNAVTLSSSTKELYGINFMNLIFVKETPPFNNNNEFLFDITKTISNINIVNTNANMFKNWQLVENLNIKNNPLYINTDTTLDFNSIYHNEIYVDSNLVLSFDNFVGSSYSKKTSPIKIYVIQNWNVTIAVSGLNQSLDILGTNGTKINEPSAGSNITIQGIRNLLCVTDYCGKWLPY